MIDAGLVEQCTSDIHPQTMQTLIQAESSGNKFAIAAVGVEISSQPDNKEDAISAAENLIDAGHNVSLGLAQINMHNFDSLGLTVESAFDPCESIAAGEKVLSACYSRAMKEYGETDNQAALQAAFSCYYSDNFERGFSPDDSNGNSYVDRIASNSEKYAVPAIKFDEAGELEKSTGGANNDEKVSKKNESDEKVTALESVDKDEKDGWDVFSEFD